MCIDVLECLFEAGFDFVHRLDAAGRDVDHPQDHGRGFVGFQQRQVVVPVGVLDRNGLDRGILDGTCDLHVRFDVGLRELRVVERVGIPTAHVNRPRDAVGHAFEAAIDVLDTIVECFGGSTGEEWFVDLHVAGAGFDERQYLVVQRLGDIDAALDGVTIIGVRDRTRDGHGSGHGDLEAPVGKGLRNPPVARQEISSRANRRGDGGQMSIRVGAIADIDGGQRVEVDAVQMPAVIVDVVFPSDFTVGGNVDSGIDLIQHHLTGSPRKDGFPLVPERSQCLHVVPSGISHLVGAIGEPVGNRDVVRFGIGPNRGRQ